MDSEANTEPASPVVAKWTIFHAIPKREDEASGGAIRFLMRVIGLDEKNAKLLKEYALGAVKREAEFARDRGPEWCRNLQAASAEVSSSQFSDALEAMDRETNEFRAREISCLSLILEAESLAQFNRWIEGELCRRMKLERTDWARVVAAPGFDRKAFAARICGNQDRENSRPPD